MSAWAGQRRTFGASIRRNAIPAAIRNGHVNRDGQKTVTSTSHAPPGEGRATLAHHADAAMAPGAATDGHGRGDMFGPVQRANTPGCPSSGSRGRSAQYGTCARTG